MRRTLALFSLSFFEQDRIPEPKSDLKDLACFKELEETVSRSLNPTNPADAATTETFSATRAISPFKASLKKERPLLDETLLQKLVQYRSQIPTSSRIIRASDT
jgi:hypothetical protein